MRAINSLPNKLGNIFVARPVDYSYPRRALFSKLPVHTLYSLLFHRFTCDGGNDALNTVFMEFYLPHMFARHAPLVEVASSTLINPHSTCRWGLLVSHVGTLPVSLPKLRFLTIAAHFFSTSSREPIIIRLKLAWNPSPFVNILDLELTLITSDTSHWPFFAAQTIENHRNFGTRLLSELHLTG
jgi:hypothetical protein